MAGTDEPDAHDFVDLMINLNNMNMWTNAVGEVVSYNAVTERATIQLVMNAKLEGQTETLTIPLLRGIPVLWPKGGTPAAGNEWSQTAPLEAGNPVLVWFLVHNVAEWLADGNRGRVSRKRARFSLSSAICTPGVSHKGNLIPAADKDPSAYIIRAAMTVIKDLGTPEFVALANLVDARLAKVQSTFDGHGHDYFPGPSPVAKTSGPTSELAPSIPPTLIGTLASVAATKLKAE